MYRMHSSRRRWIMCLFIVIFLLLFSLTWLMVIWETHTLSRLQITHIPGIQDSYPSPLLPDCFLTRWQLRTQHKKKRKGVYFLTRIHLHATSLLKIIICHFHLNFRREHCQMRQNARLNFLSIPFSHLQRNIFLIKSILYQSFFLAVSFLSSLF